MAEETKTQPGGGAAPPVATGGAGNKPPTPPPSTSALASVPDFGGNRGGKKRDDGLPPGSQKAKEADRKKDAERKRQEREEKRRLAPPPPLPSALPASGGAPGAPSGPQSPDTLAQGLPGEAPVRWEPDMVKEFTDEIVNAIEAHRVTKFAGAAREAGLPDLVVKKIAVDCHYQPGAKKTVQVATPRVACKWLNKAGISAEYAEEVALVTAIGAIFIQGRKLQSTLEHMLEEFKKAREQKAQQKPEPPKNQ